jgi:S1 RNA binding domain
LKHGAIVQCVVLAAEGPRIDLSCRHSRLQAAGAGQFTPMHADTDNSSNNTNTNTDIAAVVAQDAVPAVGTVVRGFVCGVSRAGCFVRLSRSCTGRVLLKDLSDNFVSSPEQEFPLGRLVAGRVLTQVCISSTLVCVLCVLYACTCVLLAYAV